MAGYAVTADYRADKLVVQVAEGTGRHCVGLAGVRVLGLGSFVLLPQDEAGTLRAAQLGPSSNRRVYLDALRLRAGLTLQLAH
jgi:hypothetical protein